MERTMIVPQDLWRDYDPYDLDLNMSEASVSEAGDFLVERYKFDAMQMPDGIVRASVKITKPSEKTKKVLLLLGDYDSPPATIVSESFAKEGFIVVTPDYTCVSSVPTTYPASLSFASYMNAGERLDKLVGSAYESNQFIYSKIVKRTIVMIEKLYNDYPIVMVTLGKSIEIGMQVIGTWDTKIKAIACLNGSGYREYLDMNKYGEETDLSIEITQERMSWLSSIAAVAYARKIKIPTLIAIGSNALEADVDRLINFQVLFGKNELFTIISPGSLDYVPPAAYRSVLVWLKAVFKKSPIPARPNVVIRINEENKIYFDIDCDPSQVIEEVKIHYSYGEYNHAMRDWYSEKAFSISYNEYIFSPKIYNEDAPMFVFAEVVYASGFIVTSLVEYIELGEHNISPSEYIPPYGKLIMVYNVEDGLHQFKEVFDGQILLENTIRMEKIPSGAKGITSDSNAIMTFRFDASTLTTPDQVLQIEMCTLKSGRTEITLYCEIDKKIVEYVVYKNLEQDDFFTSCRFSQHDFKDSDLKPLKSWVPAKAIKIKGRQLIVGNILFI